MCSNGQNQILTLTAVVFDKNMPLQIPHSHTHPSKNGRTDFGMGCVCVWGGSVMIQNKIKGALKKDSKLT